MTAPPSVPAPRAPTAAAWGGRVGIVGRVDTGGGVDTGGRMDTVGRVDTLEVAAEHEGPPMRDGDRADGPDHSGDLDHAGDSDHAGDDLVDDRLVRAHVAIRQRRYRMARDVLLAMLLDHPDSVPTLTLLATVSTLLGDAGGTLQFADAALRIGPGQPDLLAKRATALSALGRRDEARRAADAAIAYDPRSAEAYAARAGVDLAEHSPIGYAAVLDVMARARPAVAHTSPYVVTLTARYACALDGLGARAHARAVLADLIRAHPDSPTVRYQAAELESGAWRWRPAIGHLTHLLSGTDGALTVTARRRCATATRLWLVELAGFGALLALGGIAARTWWPRPGVVIAVAAVVAYVGIIAASMVSLRHGRRVIAQIIRRSPAAIAAVVIIAAMLTAQTIAAVRVGDLSRGALTWLLAAAVILGFGAVTDFMVRLSGVIGHRYKAFVHRERIAAARALESTRPTGPARILYPVDVPTPGRLSLSGIPAEPSDRAAALDDFGSYGVDVVVSTVRASGRWPDGSASDPAVEGITFPIEAGKPPREQGFDTLVATVIDRLRAGCAVAIVCRTGAERSAVVAAAVCVRLGLPPDVAWSHVERSRGVPLAVSPGQRAWLDRFASHRPDDQRTATRNGSEVGADTRVSAFPATG